MFSLEQKYIPANPTGIYPGIYNRFASLVVMVHIDHYSSYNIPQSFPGPKKKENALAFRPKDEKTGTPEHHDPSTLICSPQGSVIYLSYTSLFSHTNYQTDLQ